MRIRYVIFILLAAAGCRVGPRHSVPEVEISENWQSDSLSTLSCGSLLEVGELFDDCLLNTYLEQLLHDNYDLKRASIKICEAFALRDISAAKLLPFIDGRIAYNSAKPAGGILQPGDFSSGSVGIPLNIKQQTFISDFDAFWEIDLFGGRQREVESATASIQMERASYHDLIVSLTAEFSRTYLKLRERQKRLELVRKERDVLKEIVEEYQKRLDQGLDSEFFLLDSEKDYEQLAAEVPMLEGEILSLIYHLSILLGKPPEALVKELSSAAELPQMISVIPVGFPSDLLRRRPDIRFAERQIAKATADVGVAVADLFPKFTLTGNYGFQNLHLGNTRGNGESWGYGGNLITPFFHGGSLKANVKRFQFIRMESLMAYEQAVLRALEESESTIASFLKSRESTQNREKGWMRADQLFAHGERLYEMGLSDTLRLLERKRRAIQAEREWATSYVETEIQLIALYKSLGSGWQNLSFL